MGGSGGWQGEYPCELRGNYIGAPGRFFTQNLVFLKYFPIYVSYGSHCLLTRRGTLAEPCTYLQLAHTTRKKSSST